MKITRTLALAALLPAVWTGHAIAQDDDRTLKPELLIVVDSSASMQLPVGDGPACVARNGADLPPIDVGGNQMAMSRMNLVKIALAGTPEPIAQYACIAESNPIDPDFDVPALGNDRVEVHNRSMCCTLPVGNTCARWRPCDDDSEQFDDATADPDRHLRRDGLIQANETRIKFALMSMDGDPATVRSYGVEHRDFAVPNEINRQDAILAEGIRGPNLGIRPARGPGLDIERGALVMGHRGVLNDGNEHPGVVVGEDPDSVRRHNAYMMRELRTIVPKGPTPTTALLSDMVAYYANLDHGPDADPNLCRRRVTVLITDGGESDYYRDRNAEDPDPCVGDCQQSGYPYPPAVDSIATMARRGVTLFLIGFAGDDQARAEALGRLIAEGDPDDDGDDRDLDEVYFVVESPADMRDALSRVGSATLAGIRTRTRPLVVTPGEGDVALNDDLDGIEQVRLVSFSESDPAGGGGQYGRIAAYQYSCADARDFEEDERVPLELERTVLFDETLAVQEERTAVAGAPNGEELVGVLGGDEALFDADGNVREGGVLNEDQLRELVDAPIGDGVPLGEDPLADVADVLGGYFGGEGIVVDDDGNEQRGRRQLGEIYDGDILAVPPPRLATDNPAFKAYARARRNRPTLIAAGARDGQIHFFRLADAVEAFTFVPRLSWRNLRDGADNPGLGTLNADGPLVYGDVVECRSLGGGNANCPAEDGELEFHSMIVGGLGTGGANLFGVDISGATDALSAQDPAGRIDGNAVRAWDVVNEPALLGLRLFQDTTRQEDRLGLAVSRPLLTHVRIRDEVRAVVVAGCGDDRNAENALRADNRGVGRCVLLLDAVTGETVRRFRQNDGVADGFDMYAPMIGTPVGFPTGGIQAAERVYIGDRVGRVWRMDLRSTRPGDWSMRVVWPPLGDPDAAEGYQPGRPLVDRPSLSLREDGRLVVVFGTGADPRPAGPGNGNNNNDGFPRAHVVSFSEQVVLGGDAVEFETRTNWVLPLREQEYLSGPPVTHSNVAYFTTIEDVEEQEGACGTRIGRLYGIHFTRTEQERYVTRDGRTLNVVPGLPTFITEGGQRIEDAIALQMPPGRTAYGLSVATAPACSEGDAASTSLIINLADESAGANGDVDPGGLRAERRSGELVDDPLDQSVFDSDGLDLALDLDGRDGDGNPLGNAFSRRSLFPREALYWGTTFGR